MKYLLLTLLLSGCSLVGHDCPNLIGDVDEDGQVTCEDAVLILCELDGGGCEIGPNLWEAADVDFDGMITEYDAYAICYKLKPVDKPLHRPTHHNRITQ